MAVLLSMSGRGIAQDGVAAKAGQALDDLGRGLRRGFTEIGDTFRTKFEAVRADVQRMGVQPRVYSRLHWDRALYTAKIEVHVMRDGSVLLRGIVPDEAARKRAVELTKNTVDVNGVIDELVPLATTVETPAEPTASTKTERPK
jgi:osmotically-inducible protein OsmY